jgi:hypothetical protein
MGMNKSKRTATRTRTVKLLEEVIADRIRQTPCDGQNAISSCGSLSGRIASAKRPPRLSREKS